MPLTASLALALSVAFAPSAPAAEPAFVTAPQAQTVHEYIAEYFADIPIMIDVAKCESHFRQYDLSGSVYRGKVNNKDVGVMQINEYYHLKRSKELGLDIYTMQGNAAYARYLYEQEGVTPWRSSSPCWGNSKHMALAK